MLRESFREFLLPLVGKLDFFPPLLVVLNTEN